MPGLGNSQAQAYFIVQFACTFQLANLAGALNLVLLLALLATIKTV